MFGRGEALRLTVNSPGYDSQVADNVPYLDIAGVHDAARGALTFFVVNRHANESIDLEVSLQGFGAATVGDHQVLAGMALEAANTLERSLDGHAEKGLERRRLGRLSDRETAASLLPDDPIEPAAIIIARQRIETRRRGI